MYIHIYKHICTACVCVCVHVCRCDAVAQFRTDWQAQQGQNSYNPCCDMFQRGHVIHASSAGWAVNADSGVKCTSIIRGVWP